MPPPCSIPFSKRSAYNSSLACRRNTLSIALQVALLYASLEGRHCRKPVLYLLFAQLHFQLAVRYVDTDYVPFANRRQSQLPVGRSR